MVVSELADDPSDFLEGFPVSFELAFTLKGPIAKNVKLTKV